DVAATRGARRIVTSHYPESINWPRQVMLWDGSGKQIARLDENTATDFLFSPAGDRLVVTSRNDEFANIYDASNGRKVASIKAAGGVDRPLFSPDGKMIA